MSREENMFSHIIGTGLGPRRMDYTWRDVALYNIAVGATKDDLPYVYEKSGDFKALPTFYMTPYLNSILMQPVREVPYAPNEILGDVIIEARNGNIPNRLHMAMDVDIYKPVTPFGGTFLTKDRVNKVYDWGDKGVVGEMTMNLFDLAGNPVADLTSLHYHAAFGNFGGEPFKGSGGVVYPDREPDFVVEDQLADNQAVLYRLMGDTYSTHVDPSVGKGYGYEGTFMQGLCTLGFACRMMIQKLIPYQTERVTHFGGQLRSICYPGEALKLHGWKLEEGKVCYKLFGRDNKLLVSNGTMIWK